MERVCLRCPTGPEDLPTWLVHSVRSCAGRPVTLDFRQAPWLSCPADLVEVCRGLGMRVHSVFGVRPDLVTDVRVLVDSQVLRLWCVVPEVEALVVPARVRAGQRVRHETGDVDVEDGVSSGGEVVAGGSVRVAGELAGRVVAGLVSADAVVLCASFQAEVVAINHHYVTGDRIDPSVLGRPVRVSLVNDTMRFEIVDLSDISRASPG